MAESVLWDGKASTLERLLNLMPDCIEGFNGFEGSCLSVRTLRKISARRSVPDSAVVPIGYFVSRKTDGVAVIKRPKEAADA